MLLKAAYDGTTGITILLKLDSQVIQRIESDLLPDAGNECHLQIKTIDILVKVKYVGLDGPGISCSNRRSASHVAHSEIFLPQSLHPHELHSVTRNELQRFIQLHVCGRKDDCAAKSVARYNDSVNGIVIAQHP